MTQTVENSEVASTVLMREHRRGLTLRLQNFFYRSNSFVISVAFQKR